jgi:hypothetical protein
MRRSAHESVGIDAGIFISATMTTAPLQGIFVRRRFADGCIDNKNPVGSSTRKTEKVIQIDKELAVP